MSHFIRRCIFTHLCANKVGDKQGDVLKSRFSQWIIIIAARTHYLLHTAIGVHPGDVELALSNVPLHCCAPTKTGSYI